MLQRTLLSLAFIFSINILSAQTVTVFADSVIANPGDTVEVSVRANNWVDMVSMQGTMRWDTAVADFEMITLYGLPAMSAASFSLANADNGYITFSWFDPMLVGTNLADSSALFTFEFIMVGSIPSATPVRIMGTPTPLEFVDLTFSPLPFDTIAGEIATGPSCAATVPGFTASAVFLSVSFTDTTTGTYDSLRWDFGDGNSSTMQNPTHAFSAAGTYNVCLTVMDTCGSDAVCDSITVDLVTNLNASDQYPELTLFPNPTKNILTIRSIAPIQSGRIFSTTGAALKSFGNQTEINLGEFSSGIYFIEIEAGEKIIRKKIVLLD